MKKLTLHSTAFAFVTASCFFRQSCSHEPWGINHQLLLLINKWSGFFSGTILFGHFRRCGAVRSCIGALQISVHHRFSQCMTDCGSGHFHWERIAGVLGQSATSILHHPSASVGDNATCFANTSQQLYFSEKWTGWEVCCHPLLLSRR